VIDTGVDWEHPDLAANIWINEDEFNGTAGVDDDGNGYTDDIRGWDFYSGDNDPKPRFDDEDAVDTVISHGTHCAGIACAVGNNGRGVAGQAWNCKIMCLKGCVDDPATYGDAGVVYIDALQYAIDNGADVVSMSIGGAMTPSQMVTDMIAAGCTAGPVPGKNDDRNGVNYAVCMQNWSQMVPELDPAGAETEANEIIGVCAVQTNLEMTDYTNWSTTDHLADISAPGGSTTEGIDYLSTGLYIPGSAKFTEYIGMEGTSMATPHVAGVLALVRSLSPESTAAEVRDAVLETADYEGLYEANPTMEDHEQLGRGVLDGYAACESVSTSLPDASVVAPSLGQLVTTTTPKIVVSARRKGSRSAPLTRVTVRLDPTEGTLPTDEDAVWLDRVTNAVGGDDTPDGLDDLSGDSYPEDSRFRVELGSPLPIGSGGSETHVVEVTVTDAREVPDGADPNAPTVTVTSTFRLTAVGLSSGRHMFSVPYLLHEGSDLSNARPQTVLSQVPGGDGQGFYIARWNPSAGDPRAPGKYIRSDAAGLDDPYLAIFEPGKSYWVDVPVSTQRLIIQGESLEDRADWLIRDAAYNDHETGSDWLTPGWHQIANPFPFAIKLSSFLIETEAGARVPLATAVQDGICRGVIYGYSGGGYVTYVIPNAIVEPFEGYWFRTLTKCKLYAIPDAATTTATVSARSAEKTNLWQVDLTAKADDTVSSVSLASSASATDGFDPLLDIEQPPQIETDVVLSIESADLEDESLMRDVRGVVEDQATWRLVARTEGARDVTLNWGDLRALPREYAISLTDTQTGEVMSMRHQAVYSFRSTDGETEREFVVTVRRVDPSAAFRVLVESADTVRNGATVSFRLSEDASVDCVVLNVAGRVVRTVTRDERMAAGARSVLWDGRSDAGTAVPAGVYRLEIRARSDRGEIARALATVQR